MLNLTQNTEVNRTELPPLPRPQNLGYTRGTCAAPLSHFSPCGAVACLIGVFLTRLGAASMQTPGICPPLRPQHLEQNVSCEEMDESNRASWQQALSAEPPWALSRGRPRALMTNFTGVNLPCGRKQAKMKVAASPRDGFLRRRPRLSIGAV